MYKDIKDRKEYYRFYYQNNKEKYAKAVKKWRSKNRVECKRYAQDYYQKNRLKIRKKWREWRLKNKDRINEQRRLQKKKWRKKNPQSVRKSYMKYYLKRRRKLDLSKKLREGYRTKVNAKWREYNKRNNERVRKYKKIYHKKNKEKDQARVIGKKIPLKKSCEKCKSKFNLQRHHEDYKKPLEVITLCGKCHGKIHRKLN